MLTRKQIWRRVKKKSFNSNYYDINEDNDNNKSIVSLKKNESFVTPFIDSIKKVRFSNIASVTLIPTNKEMKYYSYP